MAKGRGRGTGKADSDLLKSTDFIEQGITDEFQKELEDLVSYFPTVESTVVESAKRMAKELSNITIGNLDLKGFQQLEAQLKKIDELNLLNEKYRKMEAQSRAALEQVKQQEIKTNTVLNQQKASEVKLSKEQEQLKQEEITTTISLEKQKQAELNTKKQQIEVENKLSKQQAATERASRQQKDAYALLSRELTKVKREAKNLGAELIALERAGKKNTDQYAQVNASFIIAKNRAAALDRQVKTLDDSVGDHQRHVGDYTNSIIKAGKGIAGLSGLMGALGNVFGIDTTLLLSLRDAHRELIKVTKDLHHVTELSKTATEENTSATLINNEVEATKTVVEEANTIATQANTAAIEEQTVAQRALNTVQKLSGGQIALIIGGLLALGAGIVAYIQHTNAAEKAEEEHQKAMDGTIIKDDQLRSSYNESVLALQELENEYRVLAGSITDVGASFDNIELKNKEALRSIKKDTKKEIFEIQNSWLSMLSDPTGMGILGPAGQLIFEHQIKQMGEISKKGRTKEKEQQNKANVEIGKLILSNATELSKKVEDIKIQAIRAGEEEDKRAERIELATVKKKYEEERKLADETISKTAEAYRHGEISATEFLTAFSKIRDAGLVLEQDYGRQVREIRNKFYLKQVLDFQEHLKETQGMQSENAKTSISLIKDESERVVAEENNRYEEEKRKIAEQNIYSTDQRIAQIKADELAEKVHQQNLTNIAVDYAEKRRALLDVISNNDFEKSVADYQRQLTTITNVLELKGKKAKEKDYQAERDQLTKIADAKNQIAYNELKNEIDRIDRLKEQGKLTEEIADLQKQAAAQTFNTKVADNTEENKQAEITTILKDPNLNRQDKIKLLLAIGASKEASALGMQGGLGLSEKTKEQIDKARKVVDQITDAIQQGLQNRSDMEQMYADKEIDFRRRNIEIQTALAASGQDNVLAEELAKYDQAQERKIQAAKEAEKQKQNLALITTFTDTLQKALESDEPFFKAFGEAAGATSLVKAFIARLFSGSALEGTEDTGTGTGKGVDGKGGMAWIIHPNERVLTKEQNKKLKGMSNEEVVKNAMAFNDIYVDNYNASNLAALQPIHVTTTTTDPAVLAELRALKEEVKNKPVADFGAMDKIGDWFEETEVRGNRNRVNHIRQLSRRSLRFHGG